MPVVCTDGGNSLSRTTGTFLDYNSAYTAMAWILFTDFANANGAVIWQQGGPSFALESLRAYNNGTNNIPMLWVNVTGFPLAAKTDGSTVLSTGTWYHFAIVRTSTTLVTLYLNGVSEVTNATDISARVAPDNALHGTQHNGTVAGLKTWNTALTVGQVQTEMARLRPAEALGNLYEWLPEWTGSGERTRDYSGNGRDWAEVGTPADGDPPPVSYGAPVLWVNAPAAVVVPPPRYSWVPELGPLLAQ
ncbi:MAG TPA: LamG-like jellyroll fold domain-containing protein [Polyangia bacterium]|nr:LamG-like jellyroll fold domain-containing protein [Polyangia bacterium]